MHKKLESVDFVTLHYTQSIVLDISEELVYQSLHSNTLKFDIVTTPTSENNYISKGCSVVQYN